jgi:putative peptidoglycan lipid II flippase
VNTETATERTAVKKTLTIATAIMMCSFMLSRVIGLVREQVIAQFGGTGTAIDSYVTAFFIPELLNHFLAEGFLAITFIPIFLRYWTGNDKDGAWRSFSNLFSIGTVAFCVAIPLAMLFTPQVLGLLGPHISNEQTLPLTVKLTRIILPAQLFFFWGAFFSSVQMAQNRFFIPALAALFYNAGIICGGVLLGPRMGVEGFAWGVLGGAFVANVLVQLPGALMAGLRYRWRFDPRHPDIKRFVMLSLPLVFGLGMSFSNEIFFRFFGSFLGEGVTSSLNYALRTMSMAIALFGQAWGVAFYPYLSKLAAQQHFKEISQLLDRALARIGTFSIPVAALCVICAPEIIRTLYEHGKFSAASTAQTAPLFALYMAGSFFFSAALFSARPFWAVQRTIPPMIVSTAVSLAVIPLYYFSSRIWGAIGIAGSAVCGMTFQFLAMYLLWQKRHGDAVSSRRLVRTLATVVGITAAATAVAWMVKQPVTALHTGWGVKADALAVILVTGVLFAAVVAGLFHATGVLRLGEMIEVFRKKR